MSLDLTEGEWDITATQTLGGDTSEPSDSYTLVIDTTPPDKSSIPLGGSDLVLNDSLPIDDVSRFFMSDTQPDTLMYSASATAGIAVALSLDQDNNLTVQALEVGTATITLEARDIAGNSASRSFQIRVTPPPISKLSLFPSSDTGLSDRDNITNKPELRFFGTDDLLSGAVVAVTATPVGTTNTQAITVTAVILENLFSANLNLLEGVWRITATQADPSAPDLLSPASTPLSVTVDTTPPAFVGDNPTGLNLPSDGFFNLADTLKPQPSPVLGAVADAWKVNDPEARVTHSVIGNDSPVVCNGTDDGQDLTDQPNNSVDMADEFIDQTAIITPGNLNYRPVDPGVGNHYICATATDVAGNSTHLGPFGPIAVDTFPPAFSIPPSFPAGVSLPADDITSTDILNVNNAHPNDIIAFAVEIIDPRAPIVPCEELPAARYRVSENGQFNAADLIGGFDENRVCVRLSDDADNPDAFQTASIVVPFYAAQLRAPSLDPGSDTGIDDTDNITNRRNVTIIGDGALPGAVITIIGTKSSAPSLGLRLPLMTTAADTQGIYFADFGEEKPLDPGSWDFVATQTVTLPLNEDGTAPDDPTDTSPPSTIYTLIVDTDPPTLSAVMIDDLMIDAGEITTVVDLGRYFSTTNAEYDTLTYTGASTNDAVATATVDGDNLTIEGFSFGTTEITVTATDRAGNTSAEQPLELMVGPVTLAIPDLDAADDTGMDDTDNITSQTAGLTFIVSDALTSGQVAVAVTASQRGTDPVVVATGMTTTTTMESYRVDLNLSEGTWDVVATQTVDGERSPSSAILTIIVDTTDPETVRDRPDVTPVLFEEPPVVNAARFFSPPDFPRNLHIYRSLRRPEYSIRGFDSRHQRPHLYRPRNRNGDHHYHSDGCRGQLLGPILHRRCHAPQPSRPGSVRRRRHGRSRHR